MCASLPASVFFRTQPTASGHWCATTSGSYYSKKLSAGQDAQECPQRSQSFVGLRQLPRSQKKGRISSRAWRLVGFLPESLAARLADGFGSCGCAVLWISKMICPKCGHSFLPLPKLTEEVRRKIAILLDELE